MSLYDRAAHSPEYIDRRLATVTLPNSLLRVLSQCHRSTGTLLMTVVSYAMIIRQHTLIFRQCAAMRFSFIFLQVPF